MLVADTAAAPAWRAPTRVAFRFVFVYFGVYVLFSDMLGGLFPIPNGYLPALGTVAPAMRGLVTWTAAHLFRVQSPLLISGSGSGDKTFDWVQTFCFLIVALAATGVWSAFDRRTHYTRLHQWFRLVMRFALGSTILTYGVLKVIPLQMSSPSLTRLLEPFGNFSPMGVLWASIGASRAYEMSTGLAEVTGGVLLFIPGLTTLGALICFADLTEVFVLNMTYDVPVKLFSFHLLMVALVLLAPDASRLLRVLVSRPRATRALVAAQLIFAAYLVGMNLHNARRQWNQYGGGAPRPALYGIWDVDEIAFNGEVRPPLLTDRARWRRVVIQNLTMVSIQRMDDTYADYPSGTDVARRTILLRKMSDRSVIAGRLAFDRPAADRLLLDGEVEGSRVRAQLRLVDRNSFLLVNRGFHWIQERPFNR